jgi:hypothetical protein
MSPEQPSPRTTVIVPTGADSRSPEAVNPACSRGIGKSRSLPDLLLKVVVPFLLIAAPVAICLAFVNANAVNVPFLDEWSYLQYVEKFLEGKLNLAEFVNVQHNEHKVCVPFSIMLLVSAVSRQNSIALMYLSVGIILLQSLCLVGIGWPRVRGRANSLLLLAPVFWLMFSLRNWENLLWGHQAHLLTCGLLIVLTVFLLDRANRSTACFMLALAAALGATFSMGNGVVIWPLGLFQLAVSGFCLLQAKAEQPPTRSSLAAVNQDGPDREEPGAWDESALHPHSNDFNRPAWVFRLTAWAAVGGLTLAYYLHTLTLRTSPGAAACRLSLEKLKRYPGEVGQYLLACLGGPCSASPDVAIASGVLIVLLLASCLCSFLAAPPAIRERACAPLTLFLFSLASALLILAGRFGGGLDSALQSRYCSFTSIGLAGLYLLLLSFGKPKSTFQALRVGMLVCLFCIAAVAGWRSGAIAGEQVRGARVVYSNMVRFIDLQSDDGLTELFSDPAWIRARAAYLRSHHLSLFAESPPVALSGLSSVTAPAPSFLLESINSEPSHTYPLQRSVVVDSSKTPSLNFRGWSVDFPARGPSKAVFVSVDSIVDIPTGMGIPRPEVVAQYRRRSFLHSGFGGTYRTDLLAKGLHVVTLKIVSPDGHSYFQTGPLATLEIK